MTQDEILALKPGRELDALVAEKVMGWTDFSPIDPTIDYGIGANGYRRNFAKDPESGRNTHFPFYSTDIAAAWEVAEQLQKQGYVVCIELLPYEETSVGVYEADPANQIAYAKAQTPAEAICKAALLAVMEG